MSGRWVTQTHRCDRPSGTEVQRAGVGAGSLWRCSVCRATHRVVDVTVEFPAGYAETVVRWEIQHVA